MRASHSMARQTRGYYPDIPITLPSAAIAVRMYFQEERLGDTYFVAAQKVARTAYSSRQQHRH
ncbi:MAG: hypothetical protein BMS9Abin36_1684 [Gammaproteobacteria bacterium]|nr:MAG: hypothetical protein BMS9Abin36_1684 [Gammaproteobacteria bacterium]